MKSFIYSLALPCGNALSYDNIVARYTTGENVCRIME